MKNGTIAKINKLGEAGYIICLLGRIATIIGGAVCLLIGIILCFVPEDMLRVELTTTVSAEIMLGEGYEDSIDVNFEGGTLEIKGKFFRATAGGGLETGTEQTEFRLSDLKWTLFAAALSFAVSYVAFHFACKLCAYFKKCDTPFTEDISKELTKLAWSLIPVCALLPSLGEFAASIMTGKINIDLKLDLTSALLVLCVFMLSYIFKHGAELQAEADETL